MLRQYALSPYYQMVSRLVYFTIVLSLLAAAVNAIVTAQRRDAAEAEAEAATA